ncbi:MAG: alkaline phosphatase PhoX, partial [Brasilonema sp.]
MKGSLHPKNDVTINPSGNESILNVIDRIGMSRRRFILTAASASVLTVVGEVSIGGFLRSVEAAPIPPGLGFSGIGFESIPPNLNNPQTGLLEKDLVSVPPGYKVEVLVAWGDPIIPGGQNWLADASQDAAAQEKQFGMHADAIHYFPLRTRGRSSNRGLLCVNHEYTHEEVLHPDGLTFIPATATAPQSGLP